MTVQFVDVETGDQRWADRFEEQAADLLTLQDLVARRVAVYLTADANLEETRFSSRQTGNPDAYRLYLRARFLMSSVKVEDMKAAVPLLQQAIGLDGGYALAHAALARAYRLLGSNVLRSVMPAAEASARAREAATRALALDETLSEAHLALGSIQRSVR